MVMRIAKNKSILSCSQSKHPSTNLRSQKLDFMCFEHKHAPSDKVLPLPDYVDDSFVHNKMKSIKNIPAANKVKPMRKSLFGTNGIECVKLIKQIEQEHNTNTRKQVERDSLGTVFNFMWCDVRALKTFKSTNCDLLLLDTTYKCIRCDQSLTLSCL
ncbi:hypothetical protein ROZALSC1DRAFT_22049 [Rozella allomycis CSF55]|uniref:Uncharacterized protein n=1 Tax=Rozella allomycis (strain CSF55) TaxID=988480 RepID=A0A4P9YME0_ROZAC|nr:hypothetical protein ROZALSC1DRAFT_22049 [Rozella allomycis CSF55]